MNTLEKENILKKASEFLDESQIKQLSNILETVISESKSFSSNSELLKLFETSKNVEGCSSKSLKYYLYILEPFVKTLNKSLNYANTDDIRSYLKNYSENSNLSKTSLDNIRRVISSFFAWLEEEEYIIKNPVKKIHKIKSIKTIKKVYSDENIENLKDLCDNLRDKSIIELLSSTGMRVGELVTLNITSVDFENKECIVLGKGGKQRKVYFDSKAKIHLKQYLASRKDNNEALFVSLFSPYNRLKISGVEIMLRKLGRKANIDKVHPHKFRRTLATKAIDKGMPVEQVQVLLGHTKIDTTMNYAIVDQTNVRNSYRKFIG